MTVLDRLRVAIEELDDSLDPVDLAEAAKFGRLLADLERGELTKILKHTPGGQQHDQSQHGIWAEGGLTEQDTATEPIELVPESEELLKHGVAKKGLSPQFGSKQKRRNQLVARLKTKRKYKPPVKGGRKRKKQGFK